MQEGWHGTDRNHGPIVHAEIRESKIWIHYDEIEDNVTEDLVTEGIPKEQSIVISNNYGTLCRTIVSNNLI